MDSHLKQQVELLDAEMKLEEVEEAWGGYGGTRDSD